MNDKIKGGCLDDLSLLLFTQGNLLHFQMISLPLYDYVALPPLKHRGPYLRTSCHVFSRLLNFLIALLNSKFTSNILNYYRRSVL